MKSYHQVAFLRTLISRPVCFLLAVCLPAFSSGSVHAAPGTYDNTIQTPAQMRPGLQTAVDDLRQSLQQMTGGEFTVTTEASGPAIVLARADDARVPAPAATLLAELKTDSTEACCIMPAGDRLWLVGRSDPALTHAVYFYLEELGCRWYFPSDKWRIVPRRDDIRLKKEIVKAPAFRSRLFFGTGGFGGKLPLDPERTIEARWLGWHRRNRFGGEFRLSGHAGEAFNLTYRKQLEAHPDWRAMINGKRVDWSITAKFCAGNPDVVALYVKDRLETYRRMRERDPDDPRAWAVSVEPADGGGHCTAPESLALGSVSDRVFYVANQVAKAVRKEFPDGHVSLFAYNEHAAVPSIAIEPNVYVQVIPYAFQRTGLTPDQLLDAWSKKIPTMGIYDYWSIPDWALDLPTFDPLRFGPERIRGWHARHVDSFLCESTFSSGAIGLPWYICGRLAWDPDTDVDALFEQFLTDCFGPAAPPMRRMLTRWSNGFYLTSHELALSFRDLDEAVRLAGDDDKIVHRIEDYALYVQYLRLRFEYQQTKRNTAERRQAADRLMHHLWNIYDSSMIHAFRLSQLLARDEKNGGNPSLGEQFDWRNHDAPGWAEIRESRQNVDPLEFIRLGVSELTPQNFQPRRFDGKLVLLSGPGDVSSEPQWSPQMFMNNSVEFIVSPRKLNDTLQLRLSAKDAVRLLVAAADGEQLLEQTVAAGDAWREEWTDVALKLPRSGFYRVSVVAQKRTFRMSLDERMPHSLAGWWNSQGTPTPKLYFYVPPGCGKLAIYANYTVAGPPRFFNPAGEQVTPTLVDDGHLILLPIPDDQQGQAWSLDRAKCAIGPMRMLNAPASFAFAAGSLLVPGDAIGTRIRR